MHDLNGSCQLWENVLLNKCYKNATNNTACLHLAFSPVSGNIQLIVFHEFCASKITYLPTFLHNLKINYNGILGLFVTLHSSAKTLLSLKCTISAEDKQCKALSCCLSSHIVDTCLFLTPINNYFKCKWIISIKKHRTTENIKLQDSFICFIQETQIKRHTQTKSEGMKKDIPCKWKWKQSWGSNIYISKINFLKKAIMRDKERHYIMKKGLIQ